MAATKTRVSVIRVPRVVVNQDNADHHHDSVQKDPAIIHVKSHHDQISKTKKEQQDVSRLKVDEMSPDLPRISNTKSDETNRTNVRVSRPSIAIQRQPSPPINTWLTHSSNNITRPEFHWKLTNKWSHGLYSCMTDRNMCCYACACWCCFRHEISSMMGEHWCLWFLNCAPLIELRTKFRQHYGIEGSIAEDCCSATFCPLCVALQLANEGRDHGHRIFS